MIDLTDAALRERLAQITAKYCDSASHGTSTFDSYTRCGRCRNEANELAAFVDAARAEGADAAYTEEQRGQTDQVIGELEAILHAIAKNALGSPKDKYASVPTHLVVEAGRLSAAIRQGGEK